MPRRIQRRRTKGWRAAAGAVYVGRGTRFGNPWRVRSRDALARVPALDGGAWEVEDRISAAGTSHPFKHPSGRITRHQIRHMTRAECVATYRVALTTPTVDLHIPQGNADPWLTVDDVRRALSGRDLMCWCPTDQPCHADVLLDLANGGGS